MGDIFGISNFVDFANNLIDCLLGREHTLSAKETCWRQSVMLYQTLSLYFLFCDFFKNKMFYSYSQFSPFLQNDSVMFRLAYVLYWKIQQSPPRERRLIKIANPSVCPAGWDFFWRSAWMYVSVLLAVRQTIKKRSTPDRVCVGLGDFTVVVLQGRWDCLVYSNNISY